MYLSGINFLQKIVILQGAPESGKSQLAITTRELIGHHNCAELRVAHLDDRFELGRYLGKILLIGSDVAGDFLSHPSAFRLKGITGGDLLAGERKHSNRLFYMAGIFNVLITCNSRLVVKLDCDRGAWARRILIFLYDQRKHLKSIPNFGHWLAHNEGSGILNLWLDGLLMANDEVAKYGTLLLTPTQKGRTDALLDESEGVRLSSKRTSNPIESKTSHQTRSLNSTPSIVQRPIAAGLSIADKSSANSQTSCLNSFIRLQITTSNATANQHVGIAMSHLFKKTEFKKVLKTLITLKTLTTLKTLYNLDARRWCILMWYISMPRGHTLSRGGLI
jgi:hypothetical protein